MDFHSECGLELLMRLNENSYSSINLDESLFPDYIDNKSIIEIVGAASTGKTLLLYQLITRCILPTRHENVKIDGCDACVIMIDTLNQIQASKIADLTALTIRDAYKKVDVEPLVETVDSIVNNALKNLTVIRCCDSDQLTLTLHTLENELLGNRRIALLAIDDITAYYWQERLEKGALSVDRYSRSLIDVIRAQISHFRIVTIYTRWKESETHLKQNLLEPTSVNYRIQLSKINGTREFTCHVQSMNSTKQFRYTISARGIKWIHQ